MKVLVVGSGGREHAIIMKLAQSSKIEKLYCAPGNGGIAKYAECFNIQAKDIDGIVKLANKLAVDMVFVSPDEPLVLGMVDALNKEGIITFGPNKRAAIIEGSKIFAKNLMRKYNIPTADYEAFSDFDKVLTYVKENNKYPTVIKANGLAAGKGVVIANSFEEAKDAIYFMMKDKIFGESGSTIVVEEFLTGPEVSALCFTDGKTIIPMVSSMDHKRALDDDKGLNTGGMGAIAPNPYYTNDVATECMTKIFIPTIEAMKQENRQFKGCLYFGLMLTSSGPKVIEYNCRFGDPETQVIMPLLKTDLVEIMEAINDERLDTVKIEWDDGVAICVILASQGYPTQYKTNMIINGLDNNGQVANAKIYHAGTKLENDIFVTSGGRVLGISVTGCDVQEAINNTYQIVDMISFENEFFRHAIGQKALQYSRNKRS